MKTYVDSSVILRRILRQAGALAEWTSIELAITSSMTRVECLRALDRERAAGRLTEKDVARGRAGVMRYIDGFSIVALDEAILERVSNPLPTALGTLDAIHLVTAILWRETRGEEIQLATHDRQMAQCAHAVGIPVIGVA